ncbi:universal stress protein [Rhizobiaceae bacterium BDR2-2]|uniref:Universal stress protein n=1 Tax=Ectorhizobium quercum TaxID=2965071 RepID=A0AAE3MZ28_9HYPH|nr:universal stress protein [Ectorhizobium quercum]MCX8997116.1 universal stress protein [Ectorhizobium quercum]
MEKINTVLAALDLEAGGDAVLARAVQLASAHAAWLVVLHVIEAEPLPPTAAHMNLTESELRATFERQAIAAIETQLIENDRTRRTDVRVAFGSPHEVITHVAREQHADVVVVGPGKGRTLKDKILGSTADRVIRASAAPVLVVRKPSAEPYRSVTVAIDGSPLSARAFTEVRRLVPDAALQLVHAADIPLTFQQALLRAGTSQAEMERYRATRADKAREELSTFQRALPGAETFPVHVLDGEPGPALVRLSKSARLDLLALGSHGRGAALQALLGSVARRVLGQASCDVLVVPGRQ